MTTPRAPKYLTTTQACSCLGFWFRRTCKRYRAYGEAVALVLAQDAVNKAYKVQPLHQQESDLSTTAGSTGCQSRTWRRRPTCRSAL